MDLAAVVHTAVESFRSIAGNKNLQLTFSSSMRPGDGVRGDAGRLEQVVSNLLTNAIKFTPDGGRVDVFVEGSSETVTVRVVDSGQGISPQFLPHVFDRFRQADGQRRAVTPDWLGATVRSVATVRDALRVLESDHVDALVSDIGLPDEDGYSLIQAIRHREAEHGGFLPALALTGYARAEDRARSLAEGFQAYISKPVEPENLTAAVAAMTHQLRDNT